MFSPLVAQLVLVAARVADETPKPEDVKAGWGALAIFLLLFAAVAVLGVSLTKHLRKAQAAEDAGLYGSDDPEPASTDAVETDRHGAP